MQIQNPTDQQAIRQSVESAGEDVLDELPGLTPGQAIIAGDAMNSPVLAHIRERYTRHGAESLDATQDWRDRWQDQQENQTRGITEAYEGDEDVNDTPL